MEKKKVSVTKVNLVLVINQNLLATVDLALLKKITQNQLVSQIIQNILGKKHLKVHQQVEIKKPLVLMERKSLKAEVTDLKASPSKSTVKRELKSKTF